MAERRMFAKMIIDSDAFLDMPLSTQALYFHLSMRADDDGFINNPKKIQRTIGATDDDLKLLIAKHFIIPFDSGVVVIKHWKIHNYIQKDRYTETTYQDEKKLLTTKENRAYTLADTECIQNGYSLDAQVSIGKVSIDQDSKDLIVGEKNPPTPPEPKKYKFNQSHMELAQYLLDCIKKNKSDFKKPSLDEWADTIRLMRERDDRKHETIRDVIEWCQLDSFWKSNILSANKLRIKFDTLEMQMNQRKEGTNGTPKPNPKQQSAEAKRFNSRPLN